MINPFVGEHNELFFDGNKLRLNDKVIQLKNVNGINIIKIQVVDKSAHLVYNICWR